jgi:hypothetical protein
MELANFRRLKTVFKCQLFGRHFVTKVIYIFEITTKFHNFSISLHKNRLLQKMSQIWKTSFLK